MKVEEFDAVIVGGGLSGLRAGLELSQKWNIAIVSKTYVVRSHSLAAQGGINAALGNVEAGKEDTPKKHAFDTVKGSDYLADQNVVMLMCEEAPKIVIEFESMGAPFSRLESGKIAQRPFGGAGVPRTCYAGDRTGHALLQTLFEQCVRKELKLYEEYFLVDLVTVRNKVEVLVAMELGSGELVYFKTPYVVLATGGFGRIYRRSTNSITNTGDGPGAAFRAGIPLEDCEFQQFHPTTLYPSNILITEGARGEGGILLNNKGERFMERVAPQQKDLAPRDIVARAIKTEILEGRGFENAYVHLDLTHLPPERIKDRLPGIREISIYFAGIDPITDPIPVVPGQHYSMGGVATKYDGEIGETSIQGLWVIGECSCLSVHGANRLGGNSLLETAVFGRYVGRKILERGLPPSVSSDLIQSSGDEKIQNTEKLFSKWETNKGKKVVEIRESMGNIMDDKVGVYRKSQNLQDACNFLGKLQKDFMDVHVETSDRRFNYGLVRTLELRNMLDLAEVSAFAALWRKESRGSHFRLDFPKRNDADYLVHSLVTRTAEGLEIKTQPVKLGTFEVKERVY